MREDAEPETATDRTNPRKDLQTRNAAENSSRLRGGEGGKSRNLIRRCL